MKKKYELKCENPKCQKALTAQDLMELKVINPLEPLLCPTCKSNVVKIDRANNKIYMKGN